MALNLTALQRQLIYNMIVSKSLTATQMANVASCSIHSVKYIRLNLCSFGTVKAPWNSSSHPQSITPSMLKALYKYLLEKPSLHLNEMVIYL